MTSRDPGGGAFRAPCGGCGLLFLVSKFYCHAVSLYRYAAFATIRGELDAQQLYSSTDTGSCAHPDCRKTLKKSSKKLFQCCAKASYCSNICRQADSYRHKLYCLSSARDEMLEGLKPTGAAGDMCAACGKRSTTLKHCSRCKNVSYCSKSCQQAHWFIHKNTCQLPAKEEKSEDPTPVDDARDKPRPVCAACGKTPDTLNQCLQCKSVSYCSKSCQQEHWLKHKPNCQTLLAKPEISNHDAEIRKQPEVKPKCSYCGSASENLKHCTRCKRVSYCSRSCQKSDWPTHKNICQDSEAKSEAVQAAAESRDACDYCGSTSDTLKRCTRCMKVSYCDRQCQQTDWSKHKVLCRASS